MCGGLLEGDFLVEEELGLVVGGDLIGEGVASVLELHLTGELDFHLDG